MCLRTKSFFRENIFFLFAQVAPVDVLADAVVRRRGEVGEADGVIHTFMTSSQRPLLAARDGLEVVQ